MRIELLQQAHECIDTLYGDSPVDGRRTTDEEGQRHHRHHHAGGPEKGEGAGGENQVSG